MTEAAHGRELVGSSSAETASLSPAQPHFTRMASSTQDLPTPRSLPLLGSGSRAQGFFFALVFLALGGALLGGCGHSGGTIPGDDPPADDNPNAPQSLDYPDRVLVLEPNVVLADQLPTVTGEVSTWAISASLPAGLVFSDVDGSISGTPTAITLQQAFKVTATNSYGSDSIWITIVVPGESRFAYQVGGTDGTIGVFGVQSTEGSLLHQGHVFQDASGVTDVSVDPLGRFVCAVDDAGLSCYVVDDVTGQLTEGDRVLIDGGPHSVFVHPSGDFVYVTSSEVNRLRGYVVDPSDGSLTMANQLTTAASPIAVIGDPSGRYMIVRHTFNSTPGDTQTPLRSYTIDPTTGALTQSAAFSMFTVDTPQMVLDPLGENLYVALHAPFEGVLRCDVVPETGKPSLATTTSAGDLPMAVAIGPHGDHAYAVNQTSGDVSVFDIDAESRDLTLSATETLGAGVNAMAISLDGSTAYVLNPTTREITIHALNATSGAFDSTELLLSRSGSGALELLSALAPVTLGATDLFVANATSGDVTAYRIDDLTGALDDGGATPIAAGTTPAAIAVHPHRDLVYVANFDSSDIQIYSIQGDGSLVDLGLDKDLLAGQPTQMAVDPAGRFVFLTLEAFDIIASYRVNQDESLSAAGSVPIGENPGGISFDPGGSFLYVPVGGNGTTDTGHVAIFDLDTDTGIPTRLSPDLLADGAPSALAFNAEGTRAYVTLRDTDLILPYDVATDGTLTVIGLGTDTQNEPMDIELSRDGRFGYAVFEDTASAGGLLLYDVNPTSGELYNQDTLAFHWRDSVPAGTAPRELELLPDGSALYVLAPGSDEIRVFTLAETDGLTTPLESETPGLGPAAMGIRVRVQ